MAAQRLHKAQFGSVNSRLTRECASHQQQTLLLQQKFEEMRKEYERSKNENEEMKQKMIELEKGKEELRVEMIKELDRMKVWIHLYVAK